MVLGRLDSVICSGDIWMKSRNILLFLGLLSHVFLLVLILVNCVGSKQKKGMVQDGEEVALVQSGKQPIWRSEYSHHIQVRKVRA